MSFILRSAFVLVAILGIIFLMQHPLLNQKVPAASKVAAVALSDLPQLGNPDAITGTLTYGRDNVGNQVPYIVYSSSTGAAATKALVFDANSTCVTAGATFPCSLIKNALSSYYGANNVQITGGSIANGDLTVGTLSIAVQP